MKLLKEWMIKEKNCKLQEDKNTLLGGFVDQIWSWKLVAER